MAPIKNGLFSLVVGLLRSMFIYKIALRLYLMNERVWNISRMLLTAKIQSTGTEIS